MTYIGFFQTADSIVFSYTIKARSYSAASRLFTIWCRDRGVSPVGVIQANRAIDIAELIG